MGGGFRAEAVPYIDENGKTQDTDTLNVTVTNITETNKTFLAGWNYVTGNVNQDTFSLPNGDVKIILGDGCNLSGMAIQDASSLTIYAQSSGNNAGKINLSGSGTNPSLICSNGDLTINGGNIKVSSPSTTNANIQSQSGNVTINGGQVTITGPETYQPGILIGSGKSITLGYTNADDFIQAQGYYAGNNSTNPTIADGKIFGMDNNGTFASIPVNNGTIDASTIAGKKLIPLSFTVKFDPNSGIGTMDDQKIAYSASRALTANTFTKYGYTFKGWNTKADGTGTSYTDGADGSKISSIHNAIVTLYAQWKLTEYKINYELNGGTNDSANPSSYTVESETITLKAPTKEGYEFAGWTLDGSTITEIAKGSKGDITLIATWTPITYKITYDLDGGSATNPTSYTIETESFTLNNPAKDGYTFNGWTGTDLTAATQIVTITKGSMGNREYTANYTQNQQEQEQEQE